MSERSEHLNEPREFSSERSDECSGVVPHASAERSEADA
jgi:hypothetical protein